MYNYLRLPIILIAMAFCYCSDSPTRPMPTPQGLELSSIGGDPILVGIGDRLSSLLAVRLMDDEGILIMGARIDFTAVQGAVQFRHSSALTNNTGVAFTSASWPEGEGVVIIDATVFGTNVSHRFTFGVSAGTVTSLSVVSGKNQITEPGLSFNEALIVEALDVDGDPVKNAIISFSSNDNTVEFITKKAMTGEDGRAQGLFTIGDATGDITIAIHTGENAEITTEANIFSLRDERIVYLDNIPEGGFSGPNRIYIMNPDGSGQIPITETTEAVDFPDWSPDGTRIVYLSQEENNGDFLIKTMNFDGSDKRGIYSNNASISEPDWSPTGDLITFSTRLGELGTPNHIFTINADGTGLGQITTDDESNNTNPSWYPDGSKIVFTRSDQTSSRSRIASINLDGTGLSTVIEHDNIAYLRARLSNETGKLLVSALIGDFDVWALFAMNADGTNETELGPFFGSHFNASWTPDGRIAYTGTDFIIPSFGLITMNFDGSNKTHIAATSTSDAKPKWIRKK